MTHTPSYDQRALTETEIDNLGLAGDDPSFIDYEDGLAALEHNLTKAEYLRHKVILMKCLENSGSAFEEIKACNVKAGL